MNTNGYIVLFPGKPTDMDIPDKPTLTNLNIDKPLLAPFWTSITSDDLDVIGKVRVYDYRGRYLSVPDRLISKKYRITYTSKKTVVFIWTDIKCKSRSKRKYKV